jgi:hypothetical protein
MSLENYYNTLQIHRGTTGSNASGGTKKTFTPVLSGDGAEFQGLINQAKSYEIMAAGQNGIKVDAKLFCSTSTSIDKDDIVKDKNGQKYRVVSEPKNTIGIDHHYKIYLQKHGVNNA